MTFIQRFGDAVNLNVHFHTLVLDGVYENYGERGMRFRPLPPPEVAEAARVVERVAARIARLLERRGLAPDSDSADPLSLDQPRPPPLDPLRHTPADLDQAPADW